MRKLMTNMIIRKAIDSCEVTYWRVADEIIGVTDGNFSRMLRKELPVEEQEKIANAIYEKYGTPEVKENG